MLLFIFLSRAIDRTTMATRNVAWVRSRNRRVDLLIPTYNEGQAILERTIIGAQSQDYDNLSTIPITVGYRLHGER
jgi:cellulose synthase/poly-beta-1,6-N-acetylglucosamine synthase-like glycosyltransferase